MAQYLTSNEMCPKRRSLTIYVNCNSSSRVQNGRSWETPYTNLQSALTEASEAYTKVYILLAKGTYIPTEIYSPSRQVGGASGLNDTRLRTFNIPNSTTIVGGFNGTEKCRKESNHSNVTILSGLNLYWHVVTVGNDIHPDIQPSVSLHNLTIEGGNAQGPTFASVIVQPFKYDHSSGGGLYIIHGSSVKLTNVTVRNNTCGYPTKSDEYTGYGGGVYCINSRLHMDKCIVSCNKAGFQGGGVEVLNTFEGNSSHSSIIKNSHFEGNTASVFGGALVCEGALRNKNSNVLIESCTFDSNSAQEGGASVVDSNDVDFKCCKFTNNFSAVTAGALAATNIVELITSSASNTTFVPSTVNVLDCTFDSNFTVGDIQLSNELRKYFQCIRFSRGGGAVTCYIGGILNIDRSTFTNNIAQGGSGGAIINGDARVNTAFGQVLNNESATTRVTKCRFLDNSALFGNGGAIASIGDDTVVLEVSRLKFRNNSAPNGIGNDIYLSNPH